MADIGVFPALPGLAWSITKTPTFQTRIQRAVSGRELRALDYPYPLWQFSLVFDFLRDDPAAGYNELRTLAGFYLACQGAFATFLYDDPSDDAVAGQAIGTGNASQAQFQLVRSFGGAVGFVEPIVAPNRVDAVYLNGITQNPSGYSVDPASGLLTFAAPPASGTVITADFSYYFRCRFIDDSYSFENFMAKLWSLKKMTFISVRP
jgi:uncharacterized protein (TIGR02217 family)